MENVFDYEQTVKGLTAEEFQAAQTELETWEDRGRELGAELRRISQHAAEARQHLESLCFELYGHRFMEDGLCELCLKFEEEPINELFDRDR